MRQKTLVQLTGKQTQLIVELGDYAEVLYWGIDVGDGVERSRLTLSRPVPYGRLDDDVPMTLLPELGRGVFSSPGLEGHRDGQHWSPVFAITQIEKNKDNIVIESEDVTAGVHLKTELKLDEHDVLQTRCTLTNIRAGVYQVNRFANTLPLPVRVNELMTYYGRWVHEFQTVRQPLLQGGYQQENRRGRTSHEHYPALVAGTSHFDEMNGEVWGFHFAWSGNHRLRVDVKADGRRYMQAEVIYFPGEIALKEGESLTTPWLYASYSHSGLNGMSHHFHSHVRDAILSKSFRDKPRPIHLNTWEGIYFEHNPEYIMSMATQAAEMGVERFIIDDGWFKGRNGDKAGLGDWFLCPFKYPNGLQPIVEHVNQLGMEFGLWFEPEMINTNSDLFRAHPEWLLAIDGYEQPTGRNQYVINLQNEEAFNFLFERLDYFLSTYNIAYIKWDMNREVVQPAHLGQASAYNQTLRYYELVDKVRVKHPQVEIESCAAGGGRIDFEVLKRTHRFWASDNNDALERQRIQRGMSYFFPPEVMGSHIGSSHCHSTRRQHSIEFRGLTALFGHMGIELDPVKETKSEKKGFERYIKLHKILRPLLHSGRTWRVPTDDQAHQIHVVVANNQSEAVAMIAQLAMPTNSLSGQLRVPGLASQGLYRVFLLDKPSNYDDIVNYQPLWTESGCEVSGLWCEKVGLTIPILDPETAILVKFERMD
ncbi:alpha-galactosidase [Vibrio metschnikovii]|uniref:alpha-galactosidase n=1 Tax=unclassified Vibrio TaxID=2614977 RepID=UPI0013730C80|nr:MULTISPECIES: alpha-galactosidase [unclassified Vibrio]EKO3605235.1 alpha-galactosidase [Vibrio metschnikovii]EKO3609804.1 alpha-galactosidase [Vibrio metschnikovii]EKO3642554.1 alpha-galactosidase [Vibrio metschnikovii]EKO3682771.1 alpha-galactosidase [Vibrio metschnikovii]EKO3697766.1 alpha-galactosidase [Vibrio metschnikovii]